jgi:hypothetical protein
MNIVDEVFVVVMEERHSGIGVLGVYADRDAALARADAELAEYDIDTKHADLWAAHGIPGEDPRTVGMSWGDGNKIMIERTRFYPAASPRFGGTLTAVSGPPDPSTVSDDSDADLPGWADGFWPAH